MTAVVLEPRVITELLTAAFLSNPGQYIISVCVALLTPADTYKLNMPQVVCNVLTCVVRRSHLSVYYSGEKEDCRVEYDAVKVV